MPAQAKAATPAASSGLAARIAAAVRGDTVEKSVHAAVNDRLTLLVGALGKAGVAIPENATEADIAGALSAASPATQASADLTTARTSLASLRGVLNTVAGKLGVTLAENADGPAIEKLLTDAIAKSGKQLSTLTGGLAAAGVKLPEGLDLAGEAAGAEVTKAVQLAVGAQVADNLSQLGVDAETLPKSRGEAQAEGSGDTSADHLAEYRRLQGKDARAAADYYAKHADAIFGVKSAAAKN